MAINGISGSALPGVQRGLQGMRRAAVEVARGARADGGVDYSRSLVEMKQHADQTRASARALKAYHENLGTLLDIRA